MNSNMKNVASSGDMNQVCSKVPPDLITLIRIVMRTFYGFEMFLCMEMLMIYPCLKEEDLAELLRLDLKVVHQYLINLKKEKFTNERSIMETSADGKQSKHSYFYINYKMMVNIIKYKLDRIRIQIESEENQFTTRANFKCTNCKKTYTDLDTKELFLTMACLYCGAEVDEDAGSLPTRSSRNLLNTFNIQTKRIFELLDRVEHVRLADFILRPDPVNMTPIFEKINSSSSSGSLGSMIGKSSEQSSGNLNNHKWSGEKTRNVDLFGQTRILINFDSNNSSGNGNKQTKELPAILQYNKTNEDDIVENRDSQLLNSVKLAADETLNNQLKENNNVNSLNNLNTTTANGKSLANLTNTSTNSNTGITNIDTNSADLEAIIMQKLLKHEKKTSNGSYKQQNSSDSSNTSSPKPVLTPNSFAESSNSTTISKTSTSSIVISRKRIMDVNSEFGVNNDDKLSQKLNHYNTDIQSDYLLANKKRKLNNGETLIEQTNGYNKRSIYTSNNSFRRNQSDGSDRDTIDDDYLLDSNDSCSNMDSNQDGECYYDDDDMMDHMMGDEDMIMPRVFVRNKLIPLDRINAKLINLMSDAEKENYINICRELYSVIYEI